MREYTIVADSSKITTTQRTYYIKSENLKSFTENIEYLFTWKTNCRHVTGRTEDF